MGLDAAERQQSQETLMPLIDVTAFDLAELSSVEPLAVVGAEPLSVADPYDVEVAGQAPSEDIASEVEAEITPPPEAHLRDRTFPIPRFHGRKAREQLTVLTRSGDAPPGQKKNLVFAVPGFMADAPSMEANADDLHNQGHPVVVFGRFPGSTMAEHIEDMLDTVQYLGLEDVPAELFDQSQGAYTTQLFLEAADRRGYTFHRGTTPETASDELILTPAAADPDQTLTHLVTNSLRSNVSEVNESFFKRGGWHDRQTLQSYGSFVWQAVSRPSSTASQVGTLSDVRLDWNDRLERKSGQTLVVMAPEDKTFPAEDYGAGVIESFRQISGQSAAAVEGAEDLRAIDFGDVTDMENAARVARASRLGWATLVLEANAVGSRPNANHNVHFYHPEAVGKLAEQVFSAEDFLAQLPQSAAAREALHAQRAERETQTDDQPGRLVAARMRIEAALELVANGISTPESIHSVTEPKPTAVSAMRLGIGSLNKKLKDQLAGTLNKNQPGEHLPA